VVDLTLLAVESMIVTCATNSWHSGYFLEVWNSLVPHHHISIP